MQTRVPIKALSAPDGRLFLVTVDGGIRKLAWLRCLSREGEEAWAVRVGDPQGLCLEPGGQVLVGDGARVLAYDGVTGQRLWRSLVGNFCAQHLIADEEGRCYAFGVGDHSTIQLGPRGSSGHLTALDARTGERLWQHRFVPGLRGVEIQEGRLMVRQFMGPLGERRMELDPGSGASLREIFALADGETVELATRPRRRKLAV